MTYAAVVHFLDKSVAARATEWGTWFVLKVPAGLYYDQYTLAQAFADEKNRAARKPLLNLIGGYPCDSEFEPPPSPRAA